MQAARAERVVSACAGWAAVRAGGIAKQAAPAGWAGGMLSGFGLRSKVRPGQEIGWAGLRLGWLVGLEVSWVLAQVSC